MRVLVTGGAGFIGSNLVEACLDAGDEVRVFDDLSTGRLENLAGVAGEILRIEGDLRDSMAEVLGRDPVEPVFAPRRPGDVRDSEADISKAERLLGWKPEVPLADGLRRTAAALFPSSGGAA